MNNNQLTFQELKSLVSVIDVACYLGYKFDRSKGIAQPSFVRYNNGGIEDRIYIKKSQFQRKARILEENRVSYFGRLDQLCTGTPRRIQCIWEQRD